MPKPMPPNGKHQAQKMPNRKPQNHHSPNQLPPTLRNTTRSKFDRVKLGASLVCCGQLRRDIQDEVSDRRGKTHHFLHTMCTKSEDFV